MANEGRRYPANLSGLLSFCTENTKSEDAPSTENVFQMDEERRKWLAEAIASMQGADPVKLMLQDIQVLMSDNSSDDSIEKKELALEDLQQHTEDIDLANDFQKIGGLHMMPSLLKSSHSGIRWRSAALIATLTQNNPYCQQEVLNMQLLPLLLLIVDSLSEDELVRIKALYALSCLTRDSEASIVEFVKNDGFSVLLRAIQTNIEKLQTKAAFMISALCRQQPSLKQTLCNIGMIEQLVGLLSSNHETFHEHLFAALYYIVTDNQQALTECHRPEFKLQSLLRERKQLLGDQEEYQDELHFIDGLLDICFTEKNEYLSADR